MRKSDFYYDLPPELIAQHPTERRDLSRLLRLDRRSGAVTHGTFRDILGILKKGDCLILNDSRVIPARIFGQKEETGGVNEFLLLKRSGDGEWETITKPGKRAREGVRFSFGGGLMTGEITKVLENGNRMVKFECDREFFSVLDEIGNMPLPPYIKEKLADKERYQTVYSREPGSAAAPTAGLHFTKELLAEIEALGVSVGYVTLHVGLGTFRPVKEEVISDHIMHTEHYVLPQATADIINRTKSGGGRVIAVGTTSCRTLESCGRNTPVGQPLCECSGDTDIFIYPGYEFTVIDGLITNFHLPESTLIMLVSALAGYENTMSAYKTAVEERYRFFSFGDACIIL
ncbi:MAG: tRNA preQ1(34) S-adenosylmethionine ribosyltransferase-isomerase QueA [Oscillospiraceae bacterium]|jgi:S-adenosylmethionine:tRNA ribosyltransferase-isomerase|nr:tRNA preQ1(34) S-adenosylmethionine ribosyltransferase-isomerase QueA [Oscillospiraceae bacterium]